MFVGKMNVVRVKSVCGITESVGQKKNVLTPATTREGQNYLYVEKMERRIMIVLLNVSRVSRWSVRVDVLAKGGRKERNVEEEEEVEIIMGSVQRG